MLLHDYSYPAPFTTAKRECTPKVHQGATENKLCNIISYPSNNTDLNCQVHLQLDFLQEIHTMAYRVFLNPQKLNWCYRGLTVKYTQIFYYMEGLNTFCFHRTNFVKGMVIRDTTWYFHLHLPNSHFHFEVWEMPVSAGSTAMIFCLYSVPPGAHPHGCHCFWLSAKTTIPFLAPSFPVTPNMNWRKIKLVLSRDISSSTHVWTFALLLY